MGRQDDELASAYAAFEHHYPRLMACAGRFAGGAGRPDIVGDLVHGIFIRLFERGYWRTWLAGGARFGYLREMVDSALKTLWRRERGRGAPAPSGRPDEAEALATTRAGSFDPTMSEQVAFDPTMSEQVAFEQLLRATYEALRQLHPIRAQLLHMKKMMQLDAGLIRCLFETPEAIERSVPRIVRWVRDEVLRLLDGVPDEVLVRRAASRVGERVDRAERHRLEALVDRAPLPAIPRAWDRLVRVPRGAVRTPGQPADVGGLPSVPTIDDRQALWSLPADALQRVALARMFRRLGPERPLAAWVLHLTLMFGDRAWIGACVELPEPAAFEQQRDRACRAVVDWLGELGLGGVGLDWIRSGEVTDVAW